MKKVITVFIISVITLVITLTVLWKLNIIYLNVPFEEIKKEVGKDELSQLILLDYPRLGDNLDTAYRLLDEVSFESNEQVDFYFDDHETLYVGYNTQLTQDGNIDIIDSLHLFVNGYNDSDQEKIIKLAEKLLPVENTFIQDNHDVSERRNEIARYTKTEYTDSYYYDLPDMNKYAVVRVSHDMLNISPNPEQNESNRYKVEVNFINEQALTEELEADSDQAKLPPSSEQKSREDEQVNSASGSIYEDTSAEESRDQETSEQNMEQSEEPHLWDELSVQSNNELIKDPDFLSLASQGQIKGINVSLYTPIGPTIESHMGSPDWRTETEGGYYLMYSTCNCGFGVEYDYEQYTQSPVNSYYLPINLSREDIIQYLGEPSSEAYSDVDFGYFLYYELGDHYLYVNRNADELSNSFFDSVILK